MSDDDLEAPPEGAPRPQDRVHNYRCTKCGKPGHNARTCGLTDEERRQRRKDSRR